jgi:hypothetical protein
VARFFAWINRNLPFAEDFGAGHASTEAFLTPLRRRSSPAD